LESREEAEKQLKLDPFDFITKTVNKIHVGDDKIIQIAYISALSPRLVDRPIHLWPIGSSQVGKSHFLYSVCHILLKEYYEVFTSASPKGLFYLAHDKGNDCFAGKLIFINEVESSKGALPFLRALTSQTAIDPRHLSVYDAKTIDIRIEGKRAVWFTSVKAFGEEQLRNRFTFVNPDESTEQDEEIYKHQLEGQSEDNIAKHQDFKTAQAMTKNIIENTKDLDVSMPYIQRIVWGYKNRRWQFNIFQSFLQVVTKINYKKREIKDGKLVSTEEDFNFTRDLWTACRYHIIHRISQPAQELLDHLHDTRLNADKDLRKSKADLSVEMKRSTQYIGRILKELEEAELISSEKQSNYWVYWKKPFDDVEAIQLEPETEGNMKHMKHDYGNEDRKKNEKEKVIPKSGFKCFKLEDSNILCEQCRKESTRVGK